MRKQTIYAIEQDGAGIQASWISCMVNAACTDLVQAVRNACSDYIGTEQGNRDFCQNLALFNWSDFILSVPNEICKKYGFQIADNGEADIIVDRNEQLVSDDNLPFSIHKWRDLKNKLYQNGPKVIMAFVDSAPNVHYIYEKEHLQKKPYVFQMLDSIRPLLTIRYMQDWYEKLK